MRSHPALIEQIARIIHREHLPYDQAEQRNAVGWELDGGRRHTLTEDELAEAYAEAMRRHAADRAVQRSRKEDGHDRPSSRFTGDAARRPPGAPAHYTSSAAGGCATSGWSAHLSAASRSAIIRRESAAAGARPSQPWKAPG